MIVDIVIQNGTKFSSDVCTCCGHRLPIPFMQWIWGTAGQAEGHKCGELFLCAKCCARIAHGFIADLLLMKCKHDIEAVTGRHDLLVTARNVKQVADEQLRRDNEEFELFVRRTEHGPLNGKAVPTK